MSEELQATTPEQSETPVAESAETTPEFDLALDPISEPEPDADEADEEEAEANYPTPDDGQPDADEDWLEAGLDQDEADEPDEDGDNPDFLTDFTIPELDDDALTNRTRWEQQWRGLQKVQKRVSEQAQRFSSYEQLDQALATPEGAEEVIARLSEAAKAAYPDHFAKQEAPQQEYSLWGDYYDTPQDEAPAVDKKVILEALGIDETTLTDIVQERTRAREEARLVQQAESALADVNARLQSQVPGFTVTSEELLVAMKARPNIAPHEAVILTHIGRMKKSVAHAVRGGKPQPTMPKGAKRSGVQEANTLNSIIGKFSL
jgi:hypothetical protein